MNAKIKADELVSKFNGLVNGYVGSSECPETILANSKKCALKVVNEVIYEISDFDNTDGYAQSRVLFWEEVIKEIKLINYEKTNETTD